MKKILLLIVGIVLIIFLILIISLGLIDSPSQIKYSNIDNNSVKDVIEKLVYIDNDSVIQYKSGFRDFSLIVTSKIEGEKKYKFSLDKYGEDNIILYQYFSNIDNYVIDIILLSFVILIIIFYVKAISILKKDLNI